MNISNISMLRKYIRDIYFHNNIKLSLMILLISLLRIIVVLIPPVYIMKIMDEAIPEKNLQKILFFIGIVLLAAIIDSLSGIMLEKQYSLLSKKVFMKFQKACLDHLFKLEGRYFGSNSTGERFTTIINDVYQVKNLTSPMIFGFISDTVTAVAMLAFLACVQFDMLIVVICILPLIYIGQLYFQKKGKEKSDEVRDAQSALNGVLEAIVANTVACILCNGKEYFFKKYDHTVADAEKKNLEIRMIYAQNSGILNFLATLFTILILGIGGLRVVQGTLTIGGLIAFNMYAQRLVMPVLKISGVLMTLQGVLVSLERLEAFLREPETEEETAALCQGINRESNTIAVRKVSFSYEENKVLDEIGMEFAPHAINVIVGESGGGKSTLTLLLYRIWEVDSGQIRINAYDHKSLNLKYLRDRIAIVSQDAYLFDDTIMNNIVMDESVDPEQVYRCAGVACIHDYIMSLPNRYASMTGDRGVKLSGGEKQRICLARALVRNTPIIILDEATSALDQLTEKQVIENIKKQMQNKTVIMITHRLHSVEDADVIYLLQNGKVAARGKHNELMTESSYYKKMYERNLEQDG